MHFLSLYTTGRILAVLTRPAVVFLANNYLAPGAAQGLTVTFLASALMLIGIAADPHRWFYTRHFGLVPSRPTVSFYVYAASVTMLAIAGSVGAFGIVAANTLSLPLALAALLYFISEKLADERLRIRLFEQSFRGWGVASILRSTLQIGGLCALYAVAGPSLNGWSAVLVLTAVNLAVFLPGLPPGVWRALVSAPLKNRLWLARRGLGAIGRNWRLWATAVVTGSVGHLDRVLALGVDEAILPLFVLVIMAFSIVQMALDFFYVSTNRREFLRGEVTTRQALRNRALVASLAGGLIAAAILCVAILRYSHNGPAFPLGFAVAIAIFQVAVALATIPQQIVFWSLRYDWVLRTELTFWLVLVTLAALVIYIVDSRPSLIWLVSGLACCRVVLYVALAARIEAAVAPDRRGA